MSINTSIFSIIHVSDFHYQNDFPSRERLRILKDDILDYAKKNRTYLVFSGDLVWQGNNQYEHLLEFFFAELDEYCDGMYVVPGNHDVSCNDAHTAVVQRYLEDSDQRYLYSDAGSMRLESPFGSNDPLQKFDDFSGLISSFQEKSYFGLFDLNKDFSFAGLNSAWLCAPRPDNGTDLTKLKIDPAVAEYYGSKIPDTGLKVCSFHHPFEWYSESVRQPLINYLTNKFDLILFGHVHNPSMHAGQFNNNECLILQAPAAKSKDSFGSNAYSIIRIDGDSKRYEIEYRVYSDHRRAFIEGNEICDGGIRYPSEKDQRHWYKIRTSTKSGLFERFENCGRIDYEEWEETHLKPGTDESKIYIDPKIEQLRYQDGQQLYSPKRPLSSLVSEPQKRQFVIGPKDCGLTTAAYLTFKAACENFAELRKIPIYVDLKHVDISARSIVAEAIKNCPVTYTTKEMRTLIDEGGILFLFDNLCLPQVDRFNKLQSLLNGEFSVSDCIFFCAMDGGFEEDSPSENPQISPIDDTIYYLCPFDLEEIEGLIEDRYPSLTDKSRETLLNNVVAGFTQMDEPLFASSVSLMIETLQQFPDFKPLNRVRLLDRYIECLLGRYELLDVQQGIFNSDDKIKFLSHVAGVFALQCVTQVSRTEWKEICENYADSKLLDLPNGLLQEFVRKGILIEFGELITFRADDLYSYFVAREISLNPKLYEVISKDDGFYRHRKELAYYSELESTNSEGLLVETRKRIEVLEEEILETYSRAGYDFDKEWASLLNDEDSDEESLIRTVDEVLQTVPSEETVAQGRQEQISSISRGRGVAPRKTINELEQRWLVAIKSYFQLLKYSTNLEGRSKLDHIEKALGSAELFIKGLAVKRDKISSSPATIISGVLYLNPLAHIDPVRARKEFKFMVPSSMAKVMCDLMANPQLSPAFRKLRVENNEIASFFIRHLLLEAPDSKNSASFVERAVSSQDNILMRCSMVRLKEKYLGYSIDDEHRDYFSGIIQSLADANALGISREKMEQRRRLMDIKKNLEAR